MTYRQAISLAAIISLLAAFIVQASSAQDPVPNARQAEKNNDEDAENRVGALVAAIDRQFDIWLLHRLPQFQDWEKELDAEQVDALKAAMQRRNEKRRSIRQPLGRLKRAEKIDDMIAQGAPRRLVDAILRDLPYDLPLDPRTARRLAEEYREAVLRIEQQLAEDIDEILPPRQKDIFLRGPAHYQGFLTHPVARLVLDLSPRQVEQLNRWYLTHDDLYRARVAGAEVRDNVRADGQKVRLINPGPADDRELKARYEMYAVLTPGQLDQWLRLRGQISGDQTVEDWLAKRKNLEQAIARPLLGLPAATPN